MLPMLNCQIQILIQKLEFGRPGISSHNMDLGFRQILPGLMQSFLTLTSFDPPVLILN